MGITTINLHGKKGDDMFEPDSKIVLLLKERNDLLDSPDYDYDVIDIRLERNLWDIEVELNKLFNKGEENNE